MIVLINLKMPGELLIEGITLSKKQVKQFNIKYKNKYIIR